MTYSFFSKYKTDVIKVFVGGILLHNVVFCFSLTPFYFLEIGVGLAGFGVAFLFLGMLLLFDKGLLAVGNVSSSLISFGRKLRENSFFFCADFIPKWSGLCDWPRANLPFLFPISQNQRHLGVLRRHFGGPFGISTYWHDH